LAKYSAKKVIKKNVRGTYVCSLNVSSEIFKELFGNTRISMASLLRLSMELRVVKYVKQCGQIGYFCPCGRFLAQILF
jgi:hypothetical protein